MIQNKNCNEWKIPYLKFPLENYANNFSDFWTFQAYLEQCVIVNIVNPKKIVLLPYSFVRIESLLLLLLSTAVLASDWPAH